MIQLDLNIKWAIREWSSQGILEKVSAEQKAGWHQFHLQCLGSEVDRMKGDWEWLCEEKNHQKKGGWKNRRKVSVKLEGERQRIFCLEGPEQMAQTGWVAECSCSLPRSLQEISGNCPAFACALAQEENPLLLSALVASWCAAPKALSLPADHGAKTKELREGISPWHT